MKYYFQKSKGILALNWKKIYPHIYKDSKRLLPMGPTFKRFLEALLEQKINNSKRITCIYKTMEGREINNNLRVKSISIDLKILHQ